MNKQLILSSVVSFALGAGITALVWSRSKPADEEKAPESPLREVNAVADHPSTSPARDASAKSTSEAPKPDNMDQWLEAMQKPVATEAEIEAYLETRGRSRIALIAAGLMTRDDALLKEAAERFPDDPMVQFLAISNNLFPDQRREWIERFSASQPENALAAYYMAGEHFKAGDPEAAIAELRRGSGLDKFEDFSTASLLEMDAMALSLGKTPLEAKARSTFLMPLSYLGELHKITEELASAREKASSPERANELAAIGAAIGNDLSQGPAGRTLINQLVGLGIEGKFLKQLDPALVSPYFSGNPEAMLAEIKADIDGIRKLTGSAEEVFQLDASMMGHFLDRMRTSGEAAAIEWFQEWSATK